MTTEVQKLTCHPRYFLCLLFTPSLFSSEAFCVSRELNSEQSNLFNMGKVVRVTLYHFQHLSKPTGTFLKNIYIIYRFCFCPCCWKVVLNLSSYIFYFWKVTSIFRGCRHWVYRENRRLEILVNNISVRYSIQDFGFISKPNIARLHS